MGLVQFNAMGCMELFCPGILMVAPCFPPLALVCYDQLFFLLSSAVCGTLQLIWRVFLLWIFVVKRKKIPLQIVRLAPPHLFFRPLIFPVPLLGRDGGMGQSTHYRIFDFYFPLSESIYIYVPRAAKTVIISVGGSWWNLNKDLGGSFIC